MLIIIRLSFSGFPEDEQRTRSIPGHELTEKMVSLQESEVRSRCKQAVERFHREFGQTEDPTIAVFAPGRVNLIGEHTDYNGGCVLPMVSVHVHAAWERV